MAKKNVAMENAAELQKQIEELKALLAQQEAEAKRARLEAQRERALGIARTMGLGNNVTWLDESTSGVLGFSFRQPINVSEKIIAYVTVYFQHMVLGGFKLLSNGNGKVNLVGPSEKVKIKNKEVYRSLVGLSDEFHARLQHDCLKAYRQFVENKKKNGN
jgi:hypothetical protein